MNRITFNKKSVNCQRPQVDRFITPRECLPELSRKLRWGIPNKCINDVWYTKYIQQKRYAHYLDSAFGLESVTPCSSAEGGERSQPCVKLWPCTPRKKSYLSSADSILDLPSYSEAAFPELLDWSNSNILVAALGRHYHKWSWRTQSQISQGYTNYDIQCCKFDPTGELLALGTEANAVEIHDTELSKRVEEGCCSCYHIKPMAFCSITAVDWSPTGNSFITGCSRGTLVSFSRDARVIRWYSTSGNAILIARVSPDARYVTAVAVNDDEVLVFSWPMLEMIFSSSNKLDWTIKALTWHPWRSALLGIGAVTSDMNTRVALWNAPTGDMNDRCMMRDNYNLDAMLFSKITGELVLSLFNTDPEQSQSNMCSELIVMSDPDTVVDQWGKGRMGLDRVRTMVFSPDGTKLATATADEDLIIWNFLPEDKRKKKKYCKKFCSLPVFLDKTAYGVSLR